MNDVKKESPKEARGASVKIAFGAIGLIIGLLVFLFIGSVFILFLLQVNPLFRFEFEALCGAGPIGQMFVDAVGSASDALFGWL